MTQDSALRIYRALTRILPSTFRNDHRDELEGMFLLMYRGRDTGRNLSATRFWASIIWDLITQSISERISPVMRNNRHHKTSGEMMSRILADIRFALRSIIRQPTFAAMVIGMMALGIGGNAIVFRIVNGLFFQPLPFEGGEQLVDLDQTAPQWNLEYVGGRYVDFVRWRDQNQTFEGMAVYAGGGRNFTVDGDSRRVDMVFSTHDLLAVLGLNMAQGRFFLEAEDVPDGPSVAVLGHGFWEQQYGSDSSVIGQTVGLDGIDHEVIGVLPPEADFVQRADVWLPLGADPDEPSGWYLQGVGRLKAGISLETAHADLERIHKEHDRPLRRERGHLSPNRLPP